MENKSDSNDSKKQLEQRLFDGLKKGVRSPSPITYQKKEVVPISSKNVDMRPTENIATNELVKALEVLKQKQSQTSSLPPVVSAQTPFPASLTDARPTADITMDQLKKAMQETLSENQLTNILEKYQSGVASPFLRPSKPSAVLPKNPDFSSLESRLSDTETSQEEYYRPTEDISVEELHRVLRENISEKEVQTILEIGQKLHSNETERITKEKLFKSETPPPAIPSNTQKFIQPFSASLPTNSVSPAQNQSPSGIFPPKVTPFSATPLPSPTLPTSPFAAQTNPGKQTLFSSTPISPASVAPGKQTAYLAPQIPGKSTFLPLPIPSLPSEPDNTIIDPEEVPANYRIYEYFLAKKPLGSGATALVFEIFSDGARNNSIGIIKLARKGLVKLLMKEIEFAKQAIEKELLHENMIQYVKTGLTPAGLPFLVSEKLVSFPHKEFGFEDALAVVCKIADLVSSLHRNHLYHRDIKPENILFRYEGKRIVPKLFDFGTVSKQINEHHMTACSPYYAAPEVLRKIRGHHSDEILFSRADVFSLGMTLLGLIKVNPYLELERDLEKKYTDSRVLVDCLIEIQTARQSEWLECIENFVQEKSYAAALTIRSGVKYSPHKNLVETLYPLIQSMLHPNPEERPIITNIAKKIDSIFQEKIGCSTEQYLANSCSLNAAPKAE